MKFKALSIAIALISATPIALAQEGPDPNGNVIVGETPYCAAGVMRSVIVGMGTQCADGTVGPGNTPGLLDSVTVVGTDNKVDSYSTVFGSNNSNSIGTMVSGNSSTTQVGTHNSSVGLATNQFGLRNDSNGNWNTQLGNDNVSNGTGFNSQVGWANDANGTQNAQLGDNNSINGNFNTQVGHDNRVINGFSNSTSGIANELNGSQNNVNGNLNAVEGQLNSVGGSQNSVSGSRNVLNGVGVQVSANRVVASGDSVRATADDCVALGSYAECDESDEFSVGGAAIQRRVVNVADGRDANDAVNVRQVAPIADTFGAGAGFTAGAFTPPAYVYQSGATYTNVADALYDLDGRLVTLENNPGGGDGQGPQGPEGPQGPQGIQGADGRSAYEVAVANGFEGNEQDWLESLQGRDGRDGVGGGSDVAAGRNIEVEDNEDGTRSVHLSDVVELSEEGRLAVGGTTVDAQGVRIQGGPSMTRQGIDAGNQHITGVAAGRIERGSTDAVNGGQLWQFQQEVNDRWDQIDNRMANMDRRLDGLCAMGQAQAQASMSSAHIKTRNRVAVGAGYCGSKTALSLGYSRDVTTPRGSPSAFSFGVSTTGQDTAIGAGWAIGW